MTIASQLLSAASVSAEELTYKIVATTDVHGNFFRIISLRAHREKAPLPEWLQESAVCEIPSVVIMSYFWTTEISCKDSRRPTIIIS